jgi:hypothetical protein
MANLNNQEAGAQPISYPKERLPVEDSAITLKDGIQTQQSSNLPVPFTNSYLDSDQNLELNLSNAVSSPAPIVDKSTAPNAKPVHFKSHRNAEKHRSMLGHND